MLAEFFAGGRARSMSYALPIILTGSYAYLKVKTVSERSNSERRITSPPHRTGQAWRVLRPYAARWTM